uniref:Ground-like domain-containing protein n=2 Tax=Wuchereria bancrofti TaxID=6293 RepID=A0A1I8ECX9_WUCBA
MQRSIAANFATIMKSFVVLYTVFLMLIKQTTTWQSFPASCSCDPSVICPPPVICPPRICPPCPPSFPPISSPSYKPVNVCCQMCVCSVRRKRDSSSDNNTIYEMNPICNNDQLMIIMKKKIRTNATESTFAIKKATDSMLGAEFNVFCAMNDLTHVAHAENFCQYKKGNVICFAYKI